VCLSGHWQQESSNLIAHSRGEPTLADKARELRKFSQYKARRLRPRRGDDASAPALMRSRILQQSLDKEAVFLYI
jgi:hypothetical protein